MYQNEYNLRELLEFTLRVPEVGAVNFNILYYILKTIIEKQGIAEIKPDFSLQYPFATPSNVMRFNASLRRSHSAESLTNIVSKKIGEEGSKTFINFILKKQHFNSIVSAIYFTSSFSLIQGFLFILFIFF